MVKQEVDYNLFQSVLLAGSITVIVNDIRF